MKKTDLKIIVMVKVIDPNKKGRWSNVERRLEQECTSYLKIFLDPKINEALFDGTLKAKNEQR